MAAIPLKVVASAAARDLLAAPAAALGLAAPETTAEDEIKEETLKALEAHKKSAQQDLLENGMDRTEFVVSTLVLLGVVTWRDALPVMRHFDQLDVNKRGRLNAADFEALSGRPPPKGLEELTALATRNGVLKEVKKRSRAETLVEEGDFVCAASELEASKDQLSDEQVRDENKVRQKLVELSKLAEMKWRYRVVNAGESPREAALEAIECASDLLLRHEASISGKPRRDALGDITDETFRRAWASEIAEIHHGKGCTLVIFDVGDEQPAAEAQLIDALALREIAVNATAISAQDLVAASAAAPNSLPDGPSVIFDIDDVHKAQLAKAGLGDTLNSLGTLKQRQGSYEEAHTFFSRSLAVRQSLAEGDDGGKVRAQATAQSYVSLGNVVTDMGDGARAEDATRANAYYATAEEHMEAALQAYTVGFSAHHPKVAWALEGLGKIREKQGRFEEALEAYKSASEVRHKLQQRDMSKEMFKKELQLLQEKQSALTSKVVRRKNWALRASQVRMTKGAGAEEPYSLGPSASSMSRLVHAAKAEKSLKNACDSRGASVSLMATSATVASADGAEKPTRLDPASVEVANGSETESTRQQAGATHV